MEHTMEFQVTQTPDGFWCIEQDGVRSFLIEGLDNALLVDCCKGGPLAELCRGYTSRPVHLLLTHADPDHMGCADQFEYCMMHPAEYERWASRGGGMDRVLPVWEHEILDLSVNMQIGGYTFEVLHLPGHTPGSIALLERRRRFLIAGDSVQSDPVYLYGPGRNLEAYRASLLKLLAMEGSIDRIYCSHGDMVLRSDRLRPMYRFVDSVCRGKGPEPQALPGLPERVVCYEQDGVRLLLERR